MIINHFEKNVIKILKVFFIKKNILKTNEVESIDNVFQCNLNYG